MENQLLLTHSVLRLFYWQPTRAKSLIPSFTLSYLYKSPVSVPILSVNWVYQLTGYKLCPMKWSNTGNVQKMDDLMYLNARRLQSSLGIQSMFLPTTIVVASIEWVKGLMLKCCGCWQTLYLSKVFNRDKSMFRNKCLCKFGSVC